MAALCVGESIMPQSLYLCCMSDMTLFSLALSFFKLLGMHSRNNLNIFNVFKKNIYTYLFIMQ